MKLRTFFENEALKLFVWVSTVQLRHADVLRQV